LRARLVILGTRPSSKHPECGLVTCLGEMFNQAGERVLTIRWSAMIARRSQGGGR
jgi:acyl dehydratase